MADNHAPTIYIVSDGRGETCSQLVRAVLLQFGDQRFRLMRRSKVRTALRVQQILAKAAEEHAAVFYTLVGSETRQAMTEASKRLLVPTVDLMGPAFSALHDLFRTDPTGTPGLLYASERENFDRHSAIDYTLTHDDGRRPHELNQADIVIVGVSRAAKSSTCFYLAYAGVKAANVPLLPDRQPPSQLLDLPPERVIGLRINVMRLMTVREARAENLQLRFGDDYLDQRAVAQEANHANRLMEQHGWRSLDASYMAIEEVAREVMRLRRES